MQRRFVAVVLTAALAASVPALAAAAPGASIVKSIAFPVDGPVSYQDDFGAPRAGHTHEGNDIMGRKLLPELAAVDGTVYRLTFNNLSSGGNSVTIKGADGWTYHYIHVNNDTPGTDDGRATRAQAFPNDIVVGASVKKGQVVAYMGDSGNAEGTAPHLHFEIRQPAASGQYQGAAANPFQSLEGGSRLGGAQRWWLRRGPSGGQVEDLFSFGTLPGDQAVLCDWDGDAIDEPVIVRGTTWYLRSKLLGGVTVRSFEFGASGGVPLCGDLDGNGTDEPISVRNAAWAVRTGFEAAAGLDYTVAYGRVTDVPRLGDWDGDGDDDLAVFRAPSWFLRTTGQPVGSTSTAFVYGQQPGDVPVVGDWDGDGGDEPGIYRSGEWRLRQHAEINGLTVKVLELGYLGDQPLAGSPTTATGASVVGLFRPNPYG